MLLPVPGVVVDGSVSILLLVVNVEVKQKSGKQRIQLIVVFWSLCARALALVP